MGDLGVQDSSIEFLLLEISFVLSGSRPSSRSRPSAMSFCFYHGYRLKVKQSGEWRVNFLCFSHFNSSFPSVSCLISSSTLVQLSRIRYQVQFSSSHQSRSPPLTPLTPAIFGLHQRCYYYVTCCFSPMTFGIYYHRTSEWIFALHQNRYHFLTCPPTPSTFGLHQRRYQILTCPLNPATFGLHQRSCHPISLWPISILLLTCDLSSFPYDLWLTPTLLPHSDL